MCMRFRVVSFILGFLMALACFSVSTHPVLAFAISPVVVDLEVDPGTAAQGKVQITNTDGKDQTYYIGVQNFVAKGEDGAQDFLPESDITGLASWITPQTRSVRLGANETREFGYAVNVPKNAEPGGHYAAMFFSTVPLNSDRGSAVGVGAKTGLLFLLRVPGDIREDARIESFRVNSGQIDRLPAYFEMRVRNLGNVHFKPEGNVVIKNFLGQEVAKVPLNPRKSSVLPNSIRRIDTVWAKTFDVSSGGFFTELKNEWKNFAIGRYTAVAEGFYGVRKQSLAASVVFWVVPWRLIVVTVFALLILVGCLKLYHRFVVNSAVKKIRSQF